MSRVEGLGERPNLASHLCRSTDSASGEIMARDPTARYFAGTERDRAAFEAGIKLGSILHQYIGVSLTRKHATPLERAMEAAARVQPLVEDVTVRIDL